MLVAGMAPLLAAVGLGWASGAGGVFRAPAEAVHALNRYCLYFAFPVLMIGALAGPRLAVPTSFAFYSANALCFLLMAAAVRLVGVVRPALRGELGAVALGTMFGNVAYLGIPFATQVLGPDNLGCIVIGSAVHVVLSMLVGPLLLVRWGTGASGKAFDLAALARQPLVWAPIIGLAARALPADMTEAILRPGAAIGASAAPVALFVLGLYVHQNRSALHAVRAATPIVIIAKLVVLPGLALLVAWPLHGLGVLDATEARVIVLLSAMPTAITAFSIAHDHKAGDDLVAQAIVGSTAFSLATLPLVAGTLAHFG